MDPLLAPDLTVDQVLTRWKQTASVFVHRRMACVGCPMSPFETLGNVAEIYGLPVDNLMKELEQTISPRGGCS
ncbi:MAG: DUF1858 domain-containing protein [Acidobacteriota bacterium]